MKDITRDEESSSTIGTGTTSNYVDGFRGNGISYSPPIQQNMTDEDMRLTAVEQTVVYYKDKDAIPTVQALEKTINMFYNFLKGEKE